MNSTPLLRKWGLLRRLPGGRHLFGRVLGWVVPYASTLRAQILSLSPGEATVSMADRRSVRNHLRSVHAVALSNLGELCGNLALSTLQPRTGRWILSSLETDYLKKGRGRLRAHCRVDMVDWDSPANVQGTVTITDRAHDVVAVVRLNWKVGPSRNG